MRRVWRATDFFEILVQHRRLVLGGLAAVILLFYANPWVQGLRPFWALEMALYDWQLQVRGPRPVPPEVVILGVYASSRNVMEVGGYSPDDSALHPAIPLMQPHWPWDRRFHALLLERLVELGARVVVFDFVFSGSQGEGDWDFAEALEAHQDKVVIGAMFQRELTLNLEETARYLEPFDDLLPLEPDPIIGHVNQVPDADGVIRRAAHGLSLMREMNPGHPVAEQLEPDVFSLAYRARAHLGSFDDTQRDWGQLQLVNYYGPEESFQSIPVENVFLEDRLALYRGDEQWSFFRNKVVFFGPYDELAFKDVHRTPFGSMMGVEVQATLLANLLDGSTLVEVPRWAITLGTGLLLAALAVGLWSQPHIGIKLLLGGGTLVVLFLVSQWLLSSYGVVLSAGLPLLALGTLGLGDLAISFAIEQYERARVRGVLNRYVSENVAEMVLKDRRSFEERLRGETRVVTIFFSDIRGFTTLSEKAISDPTAFVTTLNEYFSEMVDLVQASKGTVSKFIGDAVMAVWGDVISGGVAADALGSVRCSLGMIKALEKLNERWLATGRLSEPLAIGIGLNSGVAVVGDIGHRRRMEFTVLGDAVNLAARLEGATKYVHQNILVGESIYEATKGEILYRRIDRLRVKGKSVPLAVYTPLAELPAPAPPWLETYHRALDAYEHRNFVEAAAGFAEAASLRGPAGDPLCEEYRHRCAAFLAEPPPADWDGAYTLSSK